MHKTSFLPLHNADEEAPSNKVSEIPSYRFHWILEFIIRNEDRLSKIKMEVNYVCQFVRQLLCFDIYCQEATPKINGP